MAKNIFRDMLKPKAQLSRNGFDRSALRNFTAKIGELLPVMTIETVPGSHYEINVSDMMRTIPMNQSAFIRASQHFEFYFVPYKQLWHRWDDFFTKRSMPLSTETGFDVPAAAPNAGLRDIIWSIGSCISEVETLDPPALTTKQVGDIGEGIGEGCKKIYNLLGYGSLQPYLSYEFNTVTPPVGFDDYKVNLLRAAAYQKIFFDYYRQPFYDLPYNGIQYQFNLDDANSSTGAVHATVSGADDRIYYRLARLFQLHYRQWKKDLFTGVLPSTQFGAVSVVNTGAASGSVAIAAQTILGSSVSGSVDLESRTIGDFGGITSGVYADGVGSGLIQVNQGSAPGLKMSGNSLSSQNITLGNGLDVDIASGDVRVTSDVLGVGSHPISVNDITVPAHSGTLTSNGTFSVLQLVHAQALQRWREITLRSGFRATEQYEGHFGVKPIFSEKDKCVFIDSVSSPLQVNTVTNTNAGASVGGTQIPLGDLGANGTSVLSGDKTIKFDAKDFGVIMCIYSMLPEATYQMQGVDPMNTKCLPDDFFVPEFENIGLQVVPMSLFKLPKDGSIAGSNGYAARYFEYKVGLDLQTDEFRASEKYPQVGGSDVTIEAGRFYGWSPSREISLDPDYSGTSAPALFARDLYVSPRYFRDIFSNLPYMTREGSPYAPQFTIGSSKYDSFVHSAYFVVKCVQPMSVLGLPRY